MKEADYSIVPLSLFEECECPPGGGHPRFAVWENVPGAYSSNKGADFRAVLEELAETEIPMPTGGKWAEAGLVELPDRQIAWRTLDAQYWGVPQRRKRIFLVTDFGGRCAGEVLFKPEGLCGDSAPGGDSPETAPTALGKGTARTGRINALAAEGKPITMLIRQPKQKGKGGAGALLQVDQSATLNTKNQQALFQPLTFSVGNVTRGADAPPSQDGICKTLRADMGGQHPCVVLNEQGDSPMFRPTVAFACNQRDEVRDLGNVSAALAAQPGMKQQTFVLNDQGGSSIGVEHDKAPTLRSEAHGNLPCVVSEVAHTLGESLVFENHPHDSGVTGPLKVCTTVNRQYGTGGGNTPLVAQAAKGGDISGTVECKWHKGYGGPSGDECGNMVLTPAYSLQGNVVDRNSGQHGLGVDEEIAPTLNTQDKYAVAEPIALDRAAFNDGINAKYGMDVKQDGKCSTLRAREPNAVASPPRYRVRRLIPLECERLNGHPDGWTDIPLNGKPASDTARYKAEGNGMAQPCADFVIAGILRILENERKGQHET